MPKRKSEPSALRTYVESNLPKQCQDACVARMCLEPDETRRTTINFAFTGGYQHAVRVIYNALCLMDIYGVEHVDLGQVQAIKEGLETYITGKR